MYLAAIPVVFIGWIYLSFPRSASNDQFAINRPTVEWDGTYTPNTPRKTGVGVFSMVTRATPTRLPASQIAVVGSPDIQYVVVTVTPSPVPTLTPNPYATLHLTLTRLWYVLTTATPYAATAYAAPQWDMDTHECILNCQLMTMTPTVTPTFTPTAPPTFVTD